MKKQQFTAAAAFAVMLVLILDCRTALTGAAEGIGLCIRTLVPSLFPFFVISALLTGNLAGNPMPLLRPLGRLCGIPEGGESFLAVGLLGGYPVGAQNIANACKQGQLSRQDAERMMPFCSNAGPSFLFGILGSMFSDEKTVWLLWGIQVLSALLTGAVTASTVGKITVRPGELSLQDALERAVRVMALVCGWAVIFRMLLCFLESWFLWMLPETAWVVIAGAMELSNGCTRLREIECEGLRFTVAGCLLSSGGLCVAMQTASAAKGLSLRRYILGKLLQCGFSFFLCTASQPLFEQELRWLPGPLILAAMVLLLTVPAIFLRRGENSSSFPAHVGV